MTLSKIEERATKLLREYEEYKLPVDVVTLAKSLGIALESRQLENEFSGFLVRRKNEHSIVVNSRHAKVRQRFTVAHEIGHYFLHSKKDVFIDGFVFHRNNPQPQGINYQEEREANSFAAGLLMPSNLVREYMEKHDPRSFKEIAEEFEVSPQAMEYRLQNLGFIQIGSS